MYFGTCLMKPAHSTIHLYSGRRKADWIGRNGGVGGWGSERRRACTVPFAVRVAREGEAGWLPDYSSVLPLQSRPAMAVLLGYAFFLFLLHSHLARALYIADSVGMYAAFRLFLLASVHCGYGATLPKEQRLEADALHYKITLAKTIFSSKKTGM